MTTNIATTASQSQRLLRCGVSAETADMYINNSGELWASPYKDNQRKDEKGFLPAWSLSALLSKVLPHNISVDKYKYKGATEYEIGCYFTGHRDKKNFNAPDPIEACVQLIEWFTANGYKLNEQ